MTDRYNPLWKIMEIVHHIWRIISNHEYKIQWHNLPTRSANIQDISTPAPLNLYHATSSYMSAFLRKSMNKGFAEVTGHQVNRGGGYELEIMSSFNLYGLKINILPK